MGRKGRNKLQNLKHEENQAKIVVELDDAKGRGLTRNSLSKKTGIFSPRILRKHLRTLTLKKVVVEERGRLYLKKHYVELKTYSLKSGELWQKLSESMLTWAKRNKLVPLDVDYSEFFTKHGVILYPWETEKGFELRFQLFAVDGRTGEGPEAKIKLLW